MGKGLTVLILAVCILPGCTTPLTAQGGLVRIIDNKAEHSCKFIATVSGFDTFSVNTGKESEHAMNEARNKAAQIEANGIRIVHMDTTFQGTSVTAEALRCEFTDL